MNRTKEALITMIHDLDPWPRPSNANWREPVVPYSDAAWERMIRVAIVVQDTKPVVVAQALREYVAKFDVPSSRGLDPVSEWSKPFLLLRVVFDMPEVEADDATYARYGEGIRDYGGFMTRPRAVAASCPDDFEFADVPETLCAPLTWVHDKPRLTGFLGGYNGPPYAAAEEYQSCRKVFPYRKNLERYLKEN